MKIASVISVCAIAVCAVFGIQQTAKSLKEAAQYQFPVA